MSKTFCALPFQHLCIGPEGTVRPCCVTEDLVTEHGAPMSLNTHSMDEIWNSAYMRNMRRGMLQGERISACQVCYQNEAASGQSYRTTIGLNPIADRPASRVEMNRYGAAAGFRVDERPGFIKLEIGNLCNLKCRMCYSAASSEIERDPVHSKWNGGIDPLHAVWRGETARIGPEPRIGVRTSGVHSQESIDDSVRCWTDGHAIFNIPLQAGTRLAGLEISFHRAGIRGQQFEVVINGRPVAKGILLNADAPVTIDLSGFGDPAELVIEVLSSKVVEAAGERERGVPLSSLVLRRNVPATSLDHTIHPQLLSPRLAIDAPWYMDDRKVFEDILKSGDTLERLYITGGEPLINERVFEVLDFLVSRGAAQHVDLELSTNCTNVSAAILDRLKKFRKVALFFSLDAIGSSYEYIRYPARWSTVDANVRKLRKENGLICCVTPTVQIYNILGLVDLYRYCDELDLAISISNVLRFPDRLAIHHLPPKVRKFAAAELLKYYNTDCQAANKPSILSLAHYLGGMTTPADPKVIREFMVFTNDLDATRGQSFATVHDELARLLAEDGFEWINDTVLASRHEQRRPARERDYAWL
jgi:glutamate-1-semialdehyde 2,1-aminomutase